MKITINFYCFIDKLLAICSSFNVIPFRLTLQFYKSHIFSSTILVIIWRYVIMKKKLFGLTEFMKKKLYAKRWQIGINLINICPWVTIIDKNNLQQYQQKHNRGLTKWQWSNCHYWISLWTDVVFFFGKERILPFQSETVKKKSIRGSQNIISRWSVTEPVAAEVLLR